jgi:phosphoenolpyruvate-protein phosphotransferase
MRTVHGIPASTGVARGPWVVLAAASAPAGGRISAADVPAELERLTVARDEAAAELEALADELARGGSDEAAIFEAQAMMAQDSTLFDAAAAAIRDGHDGIAAIRIAATGVADQLRALGDELLAARAADVLDVAERIAARLAGVDRSVVLDRPSIVVADDIPPSIAASLPRDRLLGMALESGSATSHAAILARAFGIPAVVGAAGLLPAAQVTDGASDRVAVVDGDSGEVVFEPDASAAARLDARRAAADDAARQALEEASLPAVTRDGIEVTLLANIGTPAEAERAVALGAQGVGLFRTEFLFVERSAPPTEEEQTEANRAVVAAFSPGPVTIRLLDVGGDKPIPWLPIPPEANPFLGVRALRLAGERPELFITQLRAAMRAAADGGRVKVMAPMVADASDVAVLLDLAAQARAALVADGLPHGDVELGVMLEIPSAVLVAPSFFDRIAFASLGTNDLLQYTLAADRGNAALERYRDPVHPALLRLIDSAAKDASEAGVELSVCGEMGGDPAAALALVGLGVTVLSMASSSLAPVRRAIRGADAATLRAMAHEALGATSAAEVRASFEELLPVG